MADEIDIEQVAEFMGELRLMARRLLSAEHHAHSVRATALVLSAIRRSRGADQAWSELTWQNRDHFFATMYREMRRSLTDHARRRCAAKRPPLLYLEPEDFDLYRLDTMAETRPEILLALDEALDWLEGQSPEHSAVVSHHYFSGMTVREIATLQEASEKTVKRRLAEGRVLLHQKILRLINEVPPG